MSLYRTVLTRLQAGATPESIAADLDRPSHVVEGILDTMQREGHVRRIDCEATGCSACPMGDACSLAAETPAQYVVTDAGRAALGEGATPEAGDRQ
ncbi:hypothetical protein [Halorhabdus salina]|uniref:hypothetical protein n=1 Tax=Halorhabdus salina TaxID=2750670 RepID=UPI0015EE92EA|nr:hypothetical protein [Halorhabdus salina]